MSEHSSWTNGTVTITVGDKIGLWEVLSIVNGRTKTNCFCRCKCGREKYVRAVRLANGESTACNRCGHKTHGKCRTSIYGIWNQMIQRCYNPNTRFYDRYGGRGITVCERWKTFENFLADMGERPGKMEIDRYPNNDGNYEPGNCRWATRTQQTRNQRSNALLTFNGRTMCIAAWSEETGVPPTTISQRIKRGWSIERTFTQPVDSRRGPKNRKSKNGNQGAASSEGSPQACQGISRSEEAGG